MPVVIEGLDPLIGRFENHHRKLFRALRTTMDAALLTLWENVPSYPPQPETDYIRTGTLGRTLGVGQGGGMEGSPDIYEIKQHSDFWKASFGTRLEYAPYVIGDPQDEQAAHMSYWWTLPVTVVNRSLKKIERLFVVMNEELARWLATKGGT